MTGSLRRAWTARAGLLVAMIVVGQVVLTLLDFGPRLLGWALLMTTVAALVWLLLDANETRPADWIDSRPPLVRPDAGEESSYSRILESHLDAREPGPALRDRLVALARTRDPALSDPELSDLARQPARRLSPDEIDHYLRRIEAIREGRRRDS
ncbi:hypothetical protein [Nocardioides sp. Soil805]|uniref:hypothetical protein n=1 Tax=Nocardioides sp. Soil805 TaxID=1736416 RepID=UPI0007032FD7|nr:hypothetical protein [Nocardioides sp. Soil805]KRF30272.1 hypothetical protein ASG94_19870 [Nocardioides sp. Soil805]